MVASDKSDAKPIQLSWAAFFIIISCTGMFAFISGILVALDGR